MSLSSFPSRPFDCRRRTHLWGALHGHLPPLSVKRSKTVWVLAPWCFIESWKAGMMPRSQKILKLLSELPSRIRSKEL